MRYTLRAPAANVCVRIWTALGCMRPRHSGPSLARSFASCSRLMVKRDRLLLILPQIAASSNSPLLRLLGSAQEDYRPRRARRMSHRQPPTRAAPALQHPSTRTPIVEVALGPSRCNGFSHCRKRPTLTLRTRCDCCRPTSSLIRGGGPTTIPASSMKLRAASRLGM